jgi:hypothetical protein
MFNRILLYFMLFFCLLTKDGISYAFDQLLESDEISLQMDGSLEDSLEEEESVEDWWNHALSTADPLQRIVIELNAKACFKDKQESLLNVHLEQVGPPPRMA